MNIFFTGSIRGGRSHQPECALIVKALEKYGTVLSKHVADETFSRYGETNLSNKEILEHERVALEKCEIVVAEVTTPSLGVGYLISYATFLGKRVVALYNGDTTLLLSAIIKGDPLVEVYTYTSEEDIDKILDEIFG